MKPLVVRLRNYIGDVVLSIPALERLERAGYMLQLVGKPWAKDLLAAYNWPIETYPAAFSARIAMLRLLRARAQALDPQFNQRLNALIFTTSFSSALDFRCAGYRAAALRTEARGLLLHRSKPFDATLHAIDHYWSTASVAINDHESPPSAASLKIHSNHLEEKKTRLHAAGVNSRYIVLVPYPGGAIDGVSKKWPDFHAIVAPLQAAGYTLVMAPSPSEIEFTEQHYPEAISLPALSLGAYAALTRDAALTISNDTGPGHIAASVGGKLLSVLGPTPQTLWGARGTKVTIVQEQSGWPNADKIAELALMLAEQP